MGETELFDRNHLQYVKEVHEDASEGRCFTERNSTQAGTDKISNDWIHSGRKLWNLLVPVGRSWYDSQDILSVLSEREWRYQRSVVEWNTSIPPSVSHYSQTLNKSCIQRTNVCRPLQHQILNTIRSAHICLVYVMIPHRSSVTNTHENAWHQLKHQEVILVRFDWQLLPPCHLTYI